MQNAFMGGPFMPLYSRYNKQQNSCFRRVFFQSWKGQKDKMQLLQLVGR